MGKCLRNINQLILTHRKVALYWINSSVHGRYSLRQNSLELRCLHKRQRLTVVRSAWII